MQSNKATPRDYGLGYDEFMLGQQKPVIDFHAHLQGEWMGARLPDEDEFLRGMDNHGVESACIFTLQGFYGECERENDRLAERASRHRHRLIPFCTVDPKVGETAIKEVVRCLENPLFRGLKFHTWIQACPPSMVRETLIAIFQLAAARDLPILFHDGTPPNSTTYQIAQAARWVPEAKIVLGHAGLADYVYPAGQLLRKIPNLYACFCCPKAGDLEYLIACADKDRVLFGSDFGVAGERMLAERLDDVYNAGLSPDTQHQVLYANAARLLHL